MRKIITFLSAIFFVSVLLAAYRCDGAAAATELSGAEEDAMLSLPIIPNDLTGGQPWIDSCVIGNVTAGTATSPTEDFYTWVNKEWIISAEIPDGSPTMDFDPFAEGRAKVLAALAGDELSEHDAHQAQLLFRAFINTDAPEAAGCEPVRKVIDDIRSISNIGELTDFLLDTERSAGVPTLIQVKNKQDYDEHRWVTRIDLSPWTFGSTMETMGMNAETVDPESSVYPAYSRV